MIQTMRLLFIAAGLMLCVPAAGNDAAYILLYHHVSEDTPASTSVTPEQFAVHMDYISENGYKVVPLEKLMTALNKGKKIRRRSVAISFDDAYPSVLKNALPVLKHRKWPFTVFVSTEDIDRNSPSYLSWDQLRELEKNRGTIANHGHRHQHMLNRESGESDAEWRVRIKGDIEFAQSRLEAELKKPARMFSYPYGEFDASLVQLVGELGYLAVGQQSGPLGSTSNPLAAPRFPQAKAYADLPRLAEKLNTRPFDVITPELPATVLTPDVKRPTLQLQVKAAPYRAGQFTCFVSGIATARARWQDSAATIAKVTARGEIPPGRTHYTCTAPHESIPSLFYWHSHLYMKPMPDGSWYEN
jgi:peptidoglycan/xylan/chitin deacetylase (PgdA/CDA1 family)